MIKDSGILRLFSFFNLCLLAPLEKEGKKQTGEPIKIKENLKASGWFVKSPYARLI